MITADFLLESKSLIINGQSDLQARSGNRKIAHALIVPRKPMINEFSKLSFFIRQVQSWVRVGGVLIQKFIYPFKFLDALES
jgi:hypothetical protein